MTLKNKECVNQASKTKKKTCVPFMCRRGICGKFRNIKPLPANHDYIRFKFVLLVDQINFIGMKSVFKHQHLQLFSLK